MYFTLNILGILHVTCLFKCSIYVNTDKIQVGQSKKKDNQNLSIKCFCNAQAPLKEVSN